MCRIICERELGLDLRETVEFYEVGASTVVCWKNCVCWRRILQMFFVCLQILCGYDFENYVLRMCSTQLTCNFVVVFGPKHRLLYCGFSSGIIANRIMALLVENASVKVDQVTMRHFQLKNKKQMSRITLAANNNFELQTILIGEIEPYEMLQSTALATGTPVAGAVAAARAAKKDNAVKVFWDPVVGQIERYQWNFKRWGPEPCTHLVMYSEPRLRKFSHNRVFKKEEEAGQLLEYGWDLNLSGYDPDVVATPDKQVLFNRLRQSYQKKGYRFMPL